MLAFRFLTIKFSAGVCGTSDATGSHEGRFSTEVKPDGYDSRRIRKGFSGRNDGFF